MIACRTQQMTIAGAYRHLPAIAAALVVAAAYVFFAAGGRPAGHSRYADLAEGFRQGQLHLATKPDARLGAVPNPYDPVARRDIPVLWDASYLNGRYYLYHSPLPALIVYLPYRLVSGAYPPDRIAALVFALWSFLAAVLFARGSALWILFLGLGGVVPFLLSDVRTYEIAVLAGSAMTSTWAYSLLRFAEAPRRSRALWMGLWLALAIWARPNLVVLLVIAAAVLRRQPRLAVWTLMPLIAAGASMLAYNAARFHDPLEFGESYQMTGVQMSGHMVCGIRNVPELIRFGNNFVHYVFWPISLQADFPFVTPRHSRLDPATSFPGSEHVAGILFLAPLILVAAVLLIRRRWEAPLASLVMAGGWLVLLALCTCWYVVMRYEMDYLMLMAAATVVAVERIELLPLRIASWVLALYSIAAGTLLGFAVRSESFIRLLS